MRPLIPVAMVVLIAACTDPTRVALAYGALAGTIVIRSNQMPAAGVQVTIRSSVSTTYSAQDTTDSLGTFFQSAVPVGLGLLELRHLPMGCDSVLVAPFAVHEGLVDSTTVDLPCGA
jgi:hypothetical protein